jgi:hypothetical protein
MNGAQLVSSTDSKTSVLKTRPVIATKTKKAHSVAAIRTIVVPNQKEISEARCSVLIGDRKATHKGNTPLAFSKK